MADRIVVRCKDCDPVQEWGFAAGDIASAEALARRHASLQRHNVSVVPPSGPGFQALDAGGWDELTLTGDAGDTQGSLR